MYELVGVKATIEGLTPYLAGAKQINSATDSMGKAAERAGAISSKLADGMKLATVAAGALGVALAGAAVAGAGKYQTIMAQVDALTNTSSEDTEKLSKGILDLSKRIPKSPDELGTAAYFALSSGISDVNDALSVVEYSAKAAALGLGQTKDVVDIVTAALNGYGKENITAAQATDELVAIVRDGKGEPAQLATALGSLIPLGAALKIPFADLGGTLASLTNVLAGPDGVNRATTQLQGILSQIASPSDAAKKALADTGKFASVMTQEFVPATKSAKDLSASQTDLTQAQQALNIAQREAANVLKANGPNSLQYEKAQLAVSRATEAVTKAQSKLTQVQSDAKGALRSTTDAFGSLRKEIAEKGLVPALLELQDAFGGNIEALGTIFPDVRGFLGFLSSIQSQGPQTAAIVERVRNSAGLTDEAFARMSKTLNFQVELLKNQVSVALIRLGTFLLPTVTTAVEKLITASTALSHLFGLGFNGGKIGGEFSGIEKAAFGAGEKLSDLFKWMDLHKDDAKVLAEGGFKQFQSVLQWFVNNEKVIEAALTGIAFYFAATNPIWAGIAVSGALLVGLGLFKQDLEGLSTPLVNLRADFDRLIIKATDFINTVQQSGLNKLLGVNLIPDIYNVRSANSAAKADLAQVNDLLHSRTEETNALAQAQKLLGVSQANLDKTLYDFLFHFTALGTAEGLNSSQVRTLAFAYDVLHQGQSSVSEDLPFFSKRLGQLAADEQSAADKGYAAAAGAAAIGPAAGLSAEQVESAYERMGTSAQAPDFAAASVSETLSLMGPAASEQTPLVQAAADSWSGAMADSVLGAQAAAQGIADAGRAAVQGFFDAITASIPSIAAGGTSFAGVFIEAVKAALQIQSPSKVMFDIGENVTQGLVNGIDAGGPAVQSALERYLDFVRETGDAYNDWLTYLPAASQAAALRQGLALASGFASGINAGASSVGSALSNITTKVVNATNAWRQAANTAANAWRQVGASTGWTGVQPTTNSYTPPAPSSGSAIGTGGYGAGLAGFANGGFINQPMLAMLHAPEVVLPLSNPVRSREIIASLPPQFRQSVFNSATVAPQFNIQGATLDQQERQIIRTVQGMFRQMRTNATGSGGGTRFGIG